MHRTRKRNQNSWTAHKRGTNNDDKRNRRGHDDNEENIRGLYDAQQGPDDTESDKNDARLYKAPIKQGEGPNNGRNGGMNTGRRRASLPTEYDYKFDFNKTPLTPPGKKVIVHEKTQQRRTWGVHGVPGSYIGPAMEHYQFYICYTPKTRGGGHADVVEFLPQHLIMPGLSAIEQVTKAVKELIHVINNPGPQTPFTIGESQL